MEGAHHTRTGSCFPPWQPSSGKIVELMAGNTITGRSMCLACGLLVGMAATAQVMELSFDEGRHGRVGDVAVETQPLAAVVRVVVVTTDAALIDVVGVREVDRKAGSVRVRHLVGNGGIAPQGGGAGYDTKPEQAQ
jgi:hypothetical protein